MYQKSRGVVLHTIKYSESSVIAKIYTEGFGLLSFMVKGVRSTRSKTKASLLQPLTILDLEFLHRENKPLLYIKEMKRHYNYQSLPFDTLKSAIALFILEVLHKAIREHEANEDLFVFISEALTALDQCEQLNPDFHLLFLIQLSRYLGFGAQSNDEVLDGWPLDNGHARSLQALLAADYSTVVPLTGASRRILLDSILHFYAIHADNFGEIKSVSVLKEMFN